MKQRRRTHRRGRTRPDRLRLLDAALLSPLLPKPSAQQLRIVDLGYGDSFASSLRWGKTMAEHGRSVHVIGVENEPLRVRTAQRDIAATPSEPGLVYEAQCGSFRLFEQGIEQVHYLRCMNVLRGYDPGQVKAAQLDMARCLAPSGLLLEGTSDTEGHLLAAHVWQRGETPAKLELRYLGLLCSSDFSSGFAPLMWRDVLPRDLRRDFYPGEPVHSFFSAWEQRAREQRLAQREAGQDCALDALFDTSSQGMANCRSETLVHQSLPLHDTSSESMSAHGFCYRPRALLWTPSTPSLRASVLSPGLYSLR